jgi:CO/xanthine dehydrogenase FAD-binding subunit
MKPAAFEYHAPGSVEEVLRLLAEHGDEAKILAGGQSLIPTMNFRLAQPSVLLDINGVAGLDTIEGTPEGLRIGALVRQRALERSDAVRRMAPLLAEAIPFVAHAQIRNRGTVGGNLAHADPRSELPAVALALQASFRIQGQTGERSVAAEDFFRGLFTTAVADDEMLIGVDIPRDPDGSGSAFMELSRRNGDYALMGTGCRLTLRGGRIEDARLTFLSAGDRPILATGAMDLLRGELPTPAVFDAAAEAAIGASRPIEDVHASVEYRRHLVGVLGRRVLAAAAERAGAGPS